MRWIFTGLPLATLACVSVWLASKDIGGEAGLMTLALLYGASAFCAFSSSRSIRKVAVVAWCPLLLAIPIGTIFGIIAIQMLLDDPEARSETHARIKELTPGEIGRLVRSKAKIVLEIPESRLLDSMEQELNIPPVELMNFLDELNIEFGLPVSSDDRKRVTTVEDIVHLVTSRRTQAAL